MRIGAIVVTYYPNVETLELINILIKDNNINNIIIVDNTDQNQDNKNIIKSKNIDKIIILKNNKNLGIAKAINQGMDILKEKNCNWVLTMDQDSKITFNLLIKYKFFINNNNTNNIAIISTNYIDANTKDVYFRGIWYQKEVNEVISSGSLINVNIFYAIGKLKDYYFIDQVDNEYCYRVIKNNYKIILLNGMDMIHSMGNITKVRSGILSFYLYNQKPIRTYYRIRNKIYMVKEYKDFKLLYLIIIQLIKDFIKLFFESNKYQKIIYFFKGIKDGIVGGNNC